MKLSRKTIYIFIIVKPSGEFEVKNRYTVSGLKSKIYVYKITVEGKGIDIAENYSIFLEKYL